MKKVVTNIFALHYFVVNLNEILKIGFAWQINYAIELEGKRNIWKGKEGKGRERKGKGKKGRVNAKAGKVRDDTPFI